MAIQFYNTMTRKKEEFIPVHEGEVRMYTCGPTVYNRAHIGNFRAYIFEDLLRRYLKFRGYRVIQVMNLTDIDDKIIRDSRKAGMHFTDFTRQYKNLFFKDLDILRIERAEYYPEATAHIQDMVNLIKILLEKGIGYRTSDGSVFYSIKKFPQYGKLAHLKPEQMIIGDRVMDDEYEKESIRDFSLWKAYKEEDGDAFWETELGKGRPGWHIECSAMSMRYLGNHFDIHTGGVDNIFPHHENEIAQSEGATGETFVNYWLHCEHLKVQGEKMSKSAGNFLNVGDILNMGYSALALRYVLMTTHYRHKLNFTEKKLQAAEASLQRFWDFIGRLETSSGKTLGDINEIVKKCEDSFIKAMDDDLNISMALGAIFDFIKECNVNIDKGFIDNSEAEMILTFLRRIDKIFEFIFPERIALSDEEKMMIKRREEARRARDWGTADEIRDYFLKKGYILEDTSEGTRIKRK